MPEEGKALDMDFVIFMSLVAGSTAALSTAIALLARPVVFQLAQILPLPQIPTLPLLPLPSFQL